MMNASSNPPHVMIFFRHGDRSPITRSIGSKYALDAEETQFWIHALVPAAELERAARVATVVGLNAQDEGPHEAPHDGGEWPSGQLTFRGAQECEAKGKHVRARYAALLDGIQPSEVYLRSTNVTRTNVSAQFFIAGFAPECPTTFHIRTTSPRVFVPHDGTIDFNEAFHEFRTTKKTLPKMDIPIDVLEEEIREIYGIESSERVPWTFGT